MTDPAVQRAVLITSAISSFLVPFMSSAVNIALPDIGAEFNMDAVLLGWVPTSYLLVSAMFLLPLGRVADIYGRKRMFLLGMVVYILGSLVSALSMSGFMLIAFRVIQGIGSAMTFSTSMAILTSVYPREERGRAIGISTASVYAGLSVGPFLGGILTHHLGWRSIFYLNVLLGVFVVVMILQRLKGEWAEARGEHLDLTGSILYALMLLLVMLGLSRLPSSTGAGLLVAGAIGVFAFFYAEARTGSPVLDVRIFSSNPVFAFSNLAALLHYASTYAVTFLMSLYLQYIQGFSAQSAGVILVSQPILMALFSPVAGRLSDYIEPRVIASLGLAITCLAIFMLSCLGENTGLIYIIVSLIILGLGFALFSSPNSNAIMSSVDPRYLGVASGALGTMRLLGQMLSMGLAMMIFSVIIGQVGITPEVYPLFLRSLKVALTVNSSLCLLGMFFSLVRGKVRGEA
ncbi:MAG: MFS transporter [Thermodesulfobacteriota bacterium]